MQHITDSWCSQIRSTAIMVLISFLNTHMNLLHACRERQHGISRIFILHTKNQTVTIIMYVLVIVIVLLNTSDSSRNFREYLWSL